MTGAISFEAPAATDVACFCAPGLAHLEGQPGAAAIVNLVAEAASQSHGVAAQGR